MNINRRKFLGAVTAMTGMAATQSALADIITLANNTDRSYDGYKAIVMVYLSGGNDNGNTFIPIDEKNYANYAQARQTIAIPRKQVLRLNETPLDDGSIHGLHPNLVGLHKLYKQQNLAVVQNLGTLKMPTTKEQFYGNVSQLPEKLFSHNDQQAFWEMSSEGRITGVGSRMGLSMVGQNNNPLFTTMAINGKSHALAGVALDQYVLSQSGATNFVGFNNNGKPLGLQNPKQVISQLMATTNNNIFEKELNRVYEKSLVTQQKITDSFSAAQNLAFNGSPAFKAILNMINARNTLGMKRQIFMVSLGGYDTHTNLLNAHGSLMTTLDTNLVGLYQGLEALGVQDDVAIITMSEFGRTLNSNGVGSDHGWGSHHFVLGGQVKGGIYGKTPDYSKDSLDDLGRGRYIPTTSVAQYFATVAQWFGLSNQDINLAIPYIQNFNQRNLGFI